MKQKQTQTVTKKNRMGNVEDIQYIRKMYTLISIKTKMAR